jgi:hypothetical protein
MKPLLIINLLIILGAPIGALIACIRSFKQKKLYLIDFGTLFLPPYVFIMLRHLNIKPDDTGWTFVIWPIIIGVASMYVFIFKSEVLDKGNAKDTKKRSIKLFIFLNLTAVFLAFVGRPFYE